MLESAGAIEFSQELTAGQYTALIHDAFLGYNDFLTEDQRRGSGVHRSPGTNDTDKLVIFGVINERPVYQSLSRDRRGRYHLSTVFTEPGGKHIQHDFVPASSVGSERAETVMEGSLFHIRFMELTEDPN
jgi:hypothetical protein